MVWLLKICLYNCFSSNNNQEMGLAGVVDSPFRGLSFSRGTCNTLPLRHSFVDASMAQRGMHDDIESRISQTNHVRSTCAAGRGCADTVWPNAGACRPLRRSCGPARKSDRWP